MGQGGIDRVLGAVGSFVGAAWRMSGSPRIWGDAWTWAQARAAWVGWTRIAGRWAVPGVAGMVAVIALVAIVVPAILSRDPGDEPRVELEPTATPEPAYLTEVEALPLAVASLLENGFVGDSSAHIARRIRFGEYAAAIGQSFQAEEGLLEAPSETEVWVFAFKGDVELDVADQPAVRFDNLTVVLDALTGNVLRAETFYGDFESPLRAPVWLRAPTPVPAPE